jgi:hypothetical protein
VAERTDRCWSARRRRKMHQWPRQWNVLLARPSGQPRRRTGCVVGDAQLHRHGCERRRSRHRSAESSVERDEVPRAGELHVHVERRARARSATSFRSRPIRRSPSTPEFDRSAFPDRRRPCRSTRAHSAPTRRE